MIQYLEIHVPPDRIHDDTFIRQCIQEKTCQKINQYRIFRRSVDARRKNPCFVLQIEPEAAPATGVSSHEFQLAPVKGHPSTIIVGAGPAGLFAALELIENGVKPIIIEQGADVTQRRKHIAQLLRRGTLNQRSNYCFGEGGAGTFSDGKLYTRATKRGDTRKILRLMVYHGASPDILVDAHPHIGSDKLPTVVQNLRHTIQDCGGEIHFNTEVTGFIIRDGVMTGVRLADRTTLSADAIILATGHSARKIYRTLHGEGVLIEPKPLAVGVRVEHPQSLIDTIQYHQPQRPSQLPPATYRLSCQVGNRGVYSFCMCPGGFIVPTAIAPDEMPINGMSYSKRGGAFANAGIVVEITWEDTAAFHQQAPFSFMAFQRDLEKRAFQMGGGIGQQAPAQQMMDFLENKVSSRLPKSSYRQGISPAPLHELFPPPITHRLQEAFRVFDRKLKGFLSSEALLLAVESRTSAPIRIPRRNDTMMHPQVVGLFPCGEGAGYAGGIVSSAVDGQRAAKYVASWLKSASPQTSAP